MRLFMWFSTTVVSRIQQQIELHFIVSDQKFIKNAKNGQFGEF